MQTDKFTWLSTFESFDEIPSDFLFFFFFDTFAKYCYTTTGGEPGGVSQGSLGWGVSQGRYTPYNGLDGKAPPAMSTIFRLQI